MRTDVAIKECFQFQEENLITVVQIIWPSYDLMVCKCTALYLWYAKDSKLTEIEMLLHLKYVHNKHFVHTMFMCTEYMSKIKLFVVFLIPSLNLWIICKVLIQRGRQGREAGREMRVQRWVAHVREERMWGRKRRRNGGRERWGCMGVGGRGRERYTVSKRI